MNAYRINLYEWYAGETFEQAVAAAMDAAQLPREDVVDDDASDIPVSRDMEIWEDEEMTTKTTVGALLDAMVGPGFAFGSEY